MNETDERTILSRREFLRRGMTGACLFGLGGLGSALLHRVRPAHTVWQLDPNACIQCDRCATECVLGESAVKCVHAHAMCGYCQLCTGYFPPQPNELNTAAENQLCPTGAIKRTYVEDPYYEYVVEEPLCIGCAKCVKGCSTFGNGSLFLQVRHDRCLNCNDCAIARACPAEAFRRVPASAPYLLKDRLQPPSGGAAPQ